MFLATTTEIATLIGIVTTSILSIIAALFAGLATLRAGQATAVAKTVELEIKDPITGLKPLHDLSNSNFSKLAADRDAERQRSEALTTEVTRLNQVAVDLAALTRSELRADVGASRRPG